MEEAATGSRSAGPASASPGTCARSEQAVYRARGRARWRACRERLALAARAALGIPADIALTRPGLNVPDDLDQLELEET